jgi:hypothetical protein
MFPTFKLGKYDQASIHKCFHPSAEKIESTSRDRKKAALVNTPEYTHTHMGVHEDI